MHIATHIHIATLSHGVYNPYKQAGRFLDALALHGQGTEIALSFASPFLVVFNYEPKREQKDHRYPVHFIEHARRPVVTITSNQNIK
jgi:hypothetical protein